jgi:hypothetical protein
MDSNPLIYSPKILKFTTYSSSLLGAKIRRGSGVVNYFSLIGVSTNYLAPPHNSFSAKAVFSMAASNLVAG